MNVVGALRVKNEARWIGESIASIRSLCNAGIWVLDDNSTDETRTMAWGAGACVIPSPFHGLNEVRDKNYLLSIPRGPSEDATEANPDIDWIIWIDGDEVLCNADMLRMVMEATQARAIALPVLYLWDRPDQIRVDGVYRSMSRVSVFRPGPERFEPTGPRGFHCGNAPQAIQGRVLVNAPLLHYGYMDREDRLRKYEWYRAQDPNNVAEDDYRHIVIGDVFPADSKFRHGGPLALAPTPRG